MSNTNPQQASRPSAEHIEEGELLETTAAPVIREDRAPRGPSASRQRPPEAYSSRFDPFGRGYERDPLPSARYDRERYEPINRGFERDRDHELTRTYDREIDGTGRYDRDRDFGRGYAGKLTYAQRNPQHSHGADYGGSRELQSRFSNIGPSRQISFDRREDRSWSESSQREYGWPTKPDDRRSDKSSSEPGQPRSKDEPVAKQRDEPMKPAEFIVIPPKPVDTKPEVPRIAPPPPVRPPPPPVPPARIMINEPERPIIPHEDTNILATRDKELTNASRDTVLPQNERMNECTAVAGTGSSKDNRQLIKVVRSTDSVEKTLVHSGNLDTDFKCPIVEPPSLSRGKSLVKEIEALPVSISSLLSAPVPGLNPSSMGPVISIEKVISSFEPRPSLASTIPPPELLADFVMEDDELLKPEPTVAPALPVISTLSRRKTSSWGQGMLSRASFIESANKVVEADEVVAPKNEPNCSTFSNIVTAEQISESELVIKSETSKAVDNIVEASEINHTSLADIPVTDDVEEREIYMEVPAEGIDQDEFVSERPIIESTLEETSEEDDDFESRPRKIVKGRRDQDVTEEGEAEHQAKKADNGIKVPEAVEAVAVAVSSKNPAAGASPVVDGEGVVEVVEDGRKKRGRPVVEKSNAPKQQSAEKIQLSRQTSASDKSNQGQIPASKGKGKSLVPASVVSTTSAAPTGKPRGRKPSAGKEVPRPLTARELRRNRERALLPNVFSCQDDITKAFTAIRYMVNITQGGSGAVHKMVRNEDFTPQKQVAKFPMPLTSEIAICLDIVEAKSVYIWRQLTELKREQKVIEGIKVREVEVREPSEVEIIFDIISNDIIKTIESNAANENGAASSVSLIGTLQTLHLSNEFSRNGSKEELLTALMSTLFEQNRARVDESHLTLDAIDCHPRLQLSKSHVQTIIDHNTAKIRNNRAAITAEIRGRKLRTLRAWEVLGDRYLALQHKFESTLDEDDAEEDELRRGTRGGTTSRYSARLGASSFGRGDVIRSEYDSDRMLQQLLLRESLEVRVQKGKADVTDMDCPWQDPDTKRLLLPNDQVAPTDLPLPIFVNKLSDVIDFNGNRLTLDGKRQLCSLTGSSEPCPRGCNCAKQVDIESRRERPWSDVEKCIFVDKFIQYPKNFPKIASFLTNRNTKDCIKFYYDSKAKIHYKSLLREFDNRRRNQRIAWTFTSEAAESTGASVYLSDDVNREPMIELPVDDTSYQSHLQHPPNMQFYFPFLGAMANNPILLKEFSDRRLKPVCRKIAEVPKLLTDDRDATLVDVSRNGKSEKKGEGPVVGRSRSSNGGRGRGRWGRRKKKKDSDDEDEKDDEQKEEADGDLEEETKAEEASPLLEAGDDDREDDHERLLDDEYVVLAGRGDLDDDLTNPVDMTTATLETDVSLTEIAQTNFKVASNGDEGEEGSGDSPEVDDASDDDTLEEREEATVKEDVRISEKDEYDDESDDENEEDEARDLDVNDPRAGFRVDDDEVTLKSDSEAVVDDHSRDFPEVEVDIEVDSEVDSKEDNSVSIDNCDETVSDTSTLKRHLDDVSELGTFLAEDEHAQKRSRTSPILDDDLMRNGEAREDQENPSDLNA